MSQRDTKVIGSVYRIGQIVARKGILTTYTAYNRNTNDVVGLFVIEVPPAFRPDMVQQILHPLARRQSIQSPYILQVLGWGFEGSRAYVATNPPRGTTLRYVLDNENVDFRRMLNLIQQIVLGLRDLHGQGIAGIDLRPHLITVETTGIEDRVQLDDVGLRGILSSFGYTNHHQDDDYGAFDPRYAPPEYLSSGAVGVWSDIYQVGLLLFEMVSGHLPFVGHNTAETEAMQNTAPIPRMNSSRYSIPYALQTIVDSALAKSPAQRFADANALYEALEQVQIPATPSRPSQELHRNSAALTEEMVTVSEEVTQRSSHDAQAAIYGVPSKDGVYGYLSYTKDGAEVISLPIKEENVVVGRLDPKRGVSPDIDLSDYDPRMTVSRQHARIRFEENFFYIEDLKSRNKTRLNDYTLTPLEAQALHHGDVVRFGSVQMIFKVPDM